MTHGGRGASARRDLEKGFTLVELLVVITITAILAGIAIPVFLRQRAKGFYADVVSSLKSANVAAEAYAVDQGGSYAGLDGDDGTTLESMGYRSKDTVLLAVSADNSHACVLATHSNLPAGDDWKIATFDTATGAPSASDVCVSVATPAVPGPPDPEPSAEPTEEPSAEPTEEPSAEPTEEPSAEPTPPIDLPDLPDLPPCNPPVLVPPLCD